MLWTELKPSSQARQLTSNPSIRSVLTDTVDIANRLGSPANQTFLKHGNALGTLLSQVKVF